MDHLLSRETIDHLLSSNLIRIKFPRSNSTQVETKVPIDHGHFSAVAMYLRSSSYFAGAFGFYKRWDLSSRTSEYPMKVKELNAIRDP